MLLGIDDVREAIKVKAMIEIPEQFMSESREPGKRVISKECSHNKAYNFNLLSMSMLLHYQG